MENQVLEESENYMEYRLEETRSSMKTNVDSIHMSTRFFSADEELQSVLTAAVRGQSLSTEELVDFHTNDAASLSRMVGNNPLLYSVRVYSSSDNVTEIMSLLYRKSRLKNLSWGDDADITGWHFNYEDSTFLSLSSAQNTPILSLVTPISDGSGTVGYIEAAMEMETMFPTFYSSSDEDDWAFFVDADSEIIHGTNWPEEADAFAETLIADEELLEGETIKTIRQDGQILMVFSLPQSDMGGTYIGIRDVSDSVNHVYFIRNIFVVMMIGVVILLAVLINQLVVNRMLSQLYSILGTVKAIRTDGDISVRFDEEGGESVEMDELSHQLNRMLDRIEELMRENVEREVLIKNAGIKALQNQINAHFIYNVLESIKMLAEIDEEYLISDSITSLGKMLRYSMKWTSGNVSIGEELEYIRNYIALMNFRNDFEVGLSDNIPEELYRQEIPKMSLQPIVENAILHGISPLGEDASIYIKAELVEPTAEETSPQIVQIEISDNGAGMDGETLEKQRKKLLGASETDSHGHGIGMKNVEDRIHLSFGKEYGISIYSELGKYTKVVIRIPLRLCKVNPAQ